MCLLRCYPSCPPKRVHVLPWGVWDAGPPGDAEPLRREFGVPEGARVLLTLSRISPEKGQDLLLDALLEWERREDYPQRPLWLFVCGDAAFMQGQRFLEKLKRLASRLRRRAWSFPDMSPASARPRFSRSRMCSCSRRAMRVMD